MKTVVTLSIQRDNNNEQIGKLIEKLHQLHLENQELSRQIQDLSEAEGAEEEEASHQSIHSGDRAVVLSPHKNRAGLTGYIKSTPKTAGGFVDFKPDSNQEFKVKPYHLFRLKKRFGKAKTKKNQES